MRLAPVGAVQKGVAWETQRAQIVESLKKAGPIAEGYGAYLVLEPLNRIESPQMTVLSACDAFAYAAEAGCHWSYSAPVLLDDRSGTLAV